MHLAQFTHWVLELDAALKIREDKAPMRAWPELCPGNRRGVLLALGTQGGQAVPRARVGLPLI